MKHIKIYLLAFASLFLTSYLSAQDCTDVHFTLHSDVNNGGSPQVVYSVTDYPMTTSLESGQATYNSSTTNFEFDLCLEDGCYTFTVDNNNQITLGQNIQLEITDGTNNYMLDAEIIHEDPISFSVMFCIGDTEPLDCEAILDAATLSFDLEEGTSAGQYHFTNTSTEIDNVQWSWSLGDGQVASSESVIHNYNAEGTYEICLVAHLENCVQEVCQTLVYGTQECEENPVHFLLHSDVNNGGSNQLIYSVFEAGGQSGPITSGAAQYSANNSNFEFDLCLPDGCYIFIVDNNHEIVLGENVQLEISSNQTNLMATATIIHEDPVSFSVQFGVNSNCSEEPVDCTPAVVEITNNAVSEGLQEVQFAIIDLETEDVIGFEEITFEENETTITLDYCLPDGCLGVGVMTEDPFIADEDLSIEVLVGGQSVVEAAHQEDEYTYGVLVGINSDCSGEASPCEGDFNVVATQNPGEFQFINVSSNLENVQWAWEFGDGHYSTSPNPTYQYNTNGQYEVCLYGYTPTCQSIYCTLVTVEGMVCAENLVSFTLHSDVNNGGSDELFYSVIDNATNQTVTMGIVEYSNGNANFDFQLCLPDGCYSFVVDNDNNITLGEGTELEINSSGNNLMTNSQIIHQDPISFGVLFGVNSDCTVGVEENTIVTNSVFPNPANYNLTIQSKGKSNIHRVEILDAKGTLIHSYNPNSTITTLPVSNLATGLYFVKITNGNGTDIQRFNVIH